MESQPYGGGFMEGQGNMDTAQVLGALAKIAFADDSDARVKTTEKLRALELLGKHLGIFDGHGSHMEPVTIVEDV